MKDEKQHFIDQIQGIAKELGTDSVPRHEFLRRSKVSERKIQRLFGSYTGLVEAAGMIPLMFPSSDGPTYSDQELLAQILKVIREPNAKLTRVYFEQHGQISASVCERRFGGWINTLKKAAAMLDSNTENSLIRKINEYAGPMTPISSEKSVTTPQGETGKAHLHLINPILPGHQAIDSDTNNLYGDFINFRGLQHAPVNEQGVVFLFGIICHELGYVVEIVKPGFPDCEAKRRLSGKAGMWQRVRIEFEFQSRNFRSHGHDPDRCDVIVCWENNWPECPIEVLELKTALTKLSSKSEI